MKTNKMAVTGFLCAGFCSDCTTLRALLLAILYDRARDIRTSMWYSIAAVSRCTCLCNLYIGIKVRGCTCCIDLRKLLCAVLFTRLSFY